MSNHDKGAALNYRNALFIKRQQPCQGKHVTASFKQQLQRHAPFGGLGISQYRHVSIAFTEKHLKHHVAARDGDNWGDEEDEEGFGSGKGGNSAFDLQAAHSSRMAATRYAIAATDF